MLHPLCFFFFRCTTALRKNLWILETNEKISSKVLPFLDLMIGKQKYAALLALDADGTLLNSQRKVCSLAWKELQRLAPRSTSDQHEDCLPLPTRSNHREGVLRVVATGRNLRSIQQVLPLDAPIDYVVAGSGGICVRWPTMDVVFAHHMNNVTATRVCDYLFGHGACHFFVLRCPPYHHESLAYQCPNVPAVSAETKDFLLRCSTYADFTTMVPSADALLEKLTGSRANATVGGDWGQLLVIAPRSVLADVALALELTIGPDLVRCVRTTSPTDSNVQWLEVFPPHVSKASAIGFLADANGVNIENVVAVGNDYNDEDMLVRAAVGCLVANAPSDLRNDKRFVKLTRSNDEGGVAEAIQTYFP